ncbi:MAG: hypothetical protein IPP44_13090 [Ideonella sp.]|nr:hypothetical protein [Ideonella sp.]
MASRRPTAGADAEAAAEARFEQAMHLPSLIDGAAFSFEYTPDGRAVRLTSAEAPPGQVWEVDARSGERRLVPLPAPAPTRFPDALGEGIEATSPYATRQSQAPRRFERQQYWQGPSRCRNRPRPTAAGLLPSSKAISCCAAASTACRTR